MLARFSLSVRRKVAAIVPSVFENLLFFGGLSAVTFGAWKIHAAAGYIVGGVLGVWIAFLVAAERK